MNRDAAGLRLDASTDSLSPAPTNCVRGTALRCAVTSLLLGTGAFAFAADSDNIYRGYTDETLSAIAADWQSLTGEERRDYFIEVRRRMAEAGKRRAEPPRVMGERRFGRVIPQPDGSVLRIEGVVRYRDRSEDGTAAESPPDYGTGFEQRVVQSSVAAPVVRVVSDNGVAKTDFAARASQEAAKENAKEAAKKAATEAAKEAGAEMTASEHGEGAQGRE